MTSFRRLSLFAGLLGAVLVLCAQSAFCASTYRVRYEGTQKTTAQVKGRSSIETAKYVGIHLFTVKGKADYSSRLFSAAETIESTAEGKENEKTSPSMPAIGAFDYKARSGHANAKSLDLESNIALKGFRELVLIPDKLLKKGAKFESEFNTKIGLFKAGYEVTDKKRFLKKTCLVITRVVSVISPIRGIDLRLEKWVEEITLDPKMGLPLKRRLSYVITAPGQHVERSFEVEATELKKLTGKKLAAQNEAWEKASALKKAVDLGALEGIRQAIEKVDREGEYGAVVPWAEHILALIKERCKVRKGLNMQKVSETGTHYYLYVPESYDAKKSYALIVALHGSGGRAKTMAQVWMSFADKNDAIVLAPKSKGSSWNTGVGLVTIRKLVGEMKETYNIARDRTVLFGFSAGAAMSYVVHFLCKEHAFQAVIVACGFMKMAKVRNEVAKNIAEHLPRIEGIHFYLLTGERDHCRNGVKSDRTFLTKNKGKVTFVEVPGMGHTLSEKLMPPIFEWLTKAFE